MIRPLLCERIMAGLFRNRLSPKKYIKKGSRERPERVYKFEECNIENISNELFGWRPPG
jgi:hypothetical protein